MRHQRIVIIGGILTIGLAVVWSNRLSKMPLPQSQQQAEAKNAPAGMVYIPRGEFLKGSEDPDADDDVRPLRHVFVPSFYIDRTEVTNADFQKFRPTHAYPEGEAKLPVTNVTYQEAEAYTKWAGKRLPTQEEWEKAARGTDGRRYPWGNTWERDRVTARAKGGALTPKTLLELKKKPNVCAVGTSRVRAVGSKPAGASPYGCLDMAGNAWEWVQGYYHNNPQQRILRGGAVGYGERSCRTYEQAIEGADAT